MAVEEASDDDNNVALTMAAILGTMLALLVGLVAIQSPLKDPTVESTFLAHPTQQPSKYAYEMFALWYTPIWISLFGAIVVFQLYEDFTATSYNVVCISLALPLVLQPLVFPSGGFASPDVNRSLKQRYCTKANVWLAVYSFIGNYYYTHYFYSVLKARYTMPAVRLNNVPICMFFATHFYFSTYHVLSNALLRKIVTTYAPSLSRRVLFVGTILVFSYFTAFMETLTISSFPYYDFEDRDYAYKVGSAFYGIYFLVSFPAFFFFDPHIDSSPEVQQQQQVSLWDAIVSSCGYGMMILTLLDLVRVCLGIPLVMDVP